MWFRCSRSPDLAAIRLRGGTLLLTSSGAKGAAALRGRRQEAAPGPGRALLGTQYDWECSCPTRAAARGGRAPAPPARDYVPWNPNLIHTHQVGQARMPLVCRNKQIFMMILAHQRHAPVA